MSNTNNLRRVIAIETAAKKDFNKVLDFMEKNYFPKDNKARGLPPNISAVKDEVRNIVVYFQKIHSKLFDANQIQIIKNSLADIKGFKIIEAIGEIQELKFQGIDQEEGLERRRVSIFEIKNDADKVIDFMEKEFLPEISSYELFSSKVRKIFDNVQNSVKVIYIHEPLSSFTEEEYFSSKISSLELRDMAFKIQDQIEDGTIIHIEADGTIEKIELKEYNSKKTEGSN